ncbi:HotDog domain-containing protein [Radiomyces spectabilis]|uniref:HotDog domain-containing protein n=1 Tax=Radiomyces spectabilis TaxID=64574 RepID=UPI00222024F8|nr:HotDog domain-containing protein [Radiomyces spectabilis]KAI8376132.1 HotDog domain-containing protein [Radiomyces spectabilis]
MPRSTFPAVISFSDRNEESTLVTDKPNDTEEDFAKLIAEAVDVQEIDINLYMSKELWLPLGARGAFGGQIVAQALRAAFNTVPEEYHIHSLHSYFILPGNVEIPVIYHVQRLRDGRSFVTRSVTATQKGRAIFICSFSFAKQDDSISLNHQTIMPEVADPETLPSDTERLQQYLANNELSPKMREYIQKRIEESSPVDYRDLDVARQEDVFLSDKLAASEVSRRWFKTRGQLGDDARLHACIIAYASDSGFIGTAARANGVPQRQIGMMASLDHSMWFHAPARADKWLLYDIRSPRTNSGRGVVLGSIYSRDGTLIATTAQEGIVRLSKKEQERRANQAGSSSETSLPKSGHASKL